MTIKGIEHNGFFRSSAPMPHPIPKLPDTYGERSRGPLFTAIACGALVGAGLLVFMNDRDSEPADNVTPTTVVAEQTTDTTLPTETQEPAITLPAQATEDIVGISDF